MSQQPVQQPFGSQVVAGDTWSWTDSLPDYSNALYTLKYFFRGPSALDLTATPSGNDFAITATPSQTGPLIAGIYAWQMCVFDASNNRTELARGTVQVLGDISGETAGLENRSWVKISLDNVRAVIQGRASRVENQYQINGRMLQLMKPEELMTLEGQLTARYRRELIESGQLPSSTNQVQASFGNAYDPVLARLWKNVPGNTA